MARGHPVEIATRMFTTKEEANAFFSAMLNRYKIDDKLNEEDSRDLAALIERHPEYKSKIGCGLDHFSVMRNDYGGQGFRINRVDGSGTDFSIRVCINGKPSSKKQDVLSAFRRCVRLQIWRKRDEFLKVHRGSDGMFTCAVTKQRLRIEDAHMDHRPPMTFQVLVRTFLLGRGLSYDDVPISPGDEDDAVAEVLDPALIEAFQTYHERAAVLDLVAAKQNLSQASRNRIRPTRLSPGD